MPDGLASVSEENPRMLFIRFGAAVALAPHRTLQPALESAN
jgi:hypothetical protein